MTKFKWTSITRADVIKAIEVFHAENPDYPSSKSTFIIYQDKKLPAKHIRGMAYKMAFGSEISKSEFGGGMETVRFFERLGFEMYYTGKSAHTKSKTAIKEVLPEPRLPKLSHTKPPTKEDEIIKVPSKSVIGQKNALQLLLNKIFDGDIVCEKTFPWLKTPKKIEGDYFRLFEALSEYRGDTTFAKKNVSLRCDFVCESEKLIIEYDERQHFSEARKVSLLSYPDMQIYFDKKLWVKACQDINAKDNHPFNRDEGRAYYDAIRDIKAYENGYKLIRIMHGQLDFTSKDAEEKLKEILKIKPLLTTMTITLNREDIRIGLYLQTDEFKNKRHFNKALKVVKNSEFDLFVLPEFSYVPFISLLKTSDIGNDEDLSKIFESSLQLSEEIEKAVIVSSVDKNNAIFSVFANAFANEVETKTALYIKHTATRHSAFDMKDYPDLSRLMFEPILYKGLKIGMTICYDCNHAIFSRVYGLKGIDIIINSTGGNVVYDKWYKYNKVRAIENQCYNFVTMGGYGLAEKPNSYVFGFNPEGKELVPYNLMEETDQINRPGGIYVYDTSIDDGQASEERSFNQVEKQNKNSQLEIPVGDVDKILNQSVKIADKIYVYETIGTNVIFCLVDGNDIMKPEKVLHLLYANILMPIRNKRYIIINKHEHIDDEFFRNKLSVVLKVRSMENFCAVILESDNINKCYQCGKNRTSQLVKSGDGRFDIDLSRTTGPEAVWKNKGSDTKARWRKDVEWLVNEMVKE